MALERRDPIPPGRYWLYVLQSELPRWHSWVSSNAGRVVVRGTQRDGDNTYFTFEVLAAVPWVRLGFPTILEPSSVATSQSTSTAPTPEPGFLERFERGRDEVLAQVKTVALIGAGIWILSKVLSNRR